MDRIDKALARLSKKELTKLKQLLHAISQGETRHLDIRKLKGRNDIFRARMGDMRVIYRVDGPRVFLVAIERRNEGTYKDR
jgi:mRNA-degrading endonuclease RelE of RelBE toxin-antitoxin system